MLAHPNLLSRAFSIFPRFSLSKVLVHPHGRFADGVAHPRSIISLTLKDNFSPLR